MSYALVNTGIVCPLGKDAESVLKNALDGSLCGMKAESGIVAGKTTFIGRVEGELPPIGNPLYNFRTNRLLKAALTQIDADIQNALKTFGKNRVGAVIGSSNGGLEEFYAEYALYKSGNLAKIATEHLELGAPACFVKELYGLAAPCFTVSTACSSSLKAFAAARRLLDAGFCDAVIVGGCDSVSGYVVNGFNALNSVSEKHTNPMSINRCGINIGEGAAAFLMTRQNPNAPVRLLGTGETSDAYHITSPDPSGKQVEECMRLALLDAGICATEIDYINLHGTGTRFNDSMEAAAVSDLLGKAAENAACASTKPMTGHTLGASGAIGAALCWLMMNPALNPQSLLIPHIFDGQYDPEIPRIPLAKKGARKTVRAAIVNAFAFGGSNASIVLGRTQ